MPAKNTHLMQLIDALHEFDRLKKKHPHLTVSEGGRYVPPEWMRWGEENMSRGVDGNIILLTFKEYGFIPEKNPILAKTFMKNMGGFYNHPIKPKIVDYWEAAKFGTLLQLQRYMKGGQVVDEFKLQDGVKWTALNLAAVYGRPTIVRYLVAQGASTSARDNMKRQVIHYAAQGGSVEALQFLVMEKQCDMFARDW